MDASIHASHSARWAAGREKRFKVLERRDLREALAVGVPVAIILALVSGVAFALWTPALLPVCLAVAGALLIIDRLARRRLRARPHLAAFALMSLLLAATVVPFYIDDATAPFVDGYFGLAVTATAVFMPWSPRWHVSWLATASSVYATMLLTVQMTPSFREHAALFGVTAVVVSLAGNALVRVRRQRAFGQELLVRHQRETIRTANAQLEVVVREDPLTGLANRRRLDEDIAFLEARMARGRTGLAAAIVDLDWFKAFNDTAGHGPADVALRAVAIAVRGAVRAMDRVYRYGGEELLVLIEEESEAAALATAERIVVAVRDLGVPHPGIPGGRLTVSVGAAASAGGSLTPWALIEEADRALYRAKDRGRDRAELGGPTAVSEARLDRPMVPGTAPAR